MKIQLFASYGLESWLLGSCDWNYEEIFSEVTPCVKIFNHSQVEGSQQLIAKINVNKSK